MEQCKARFAPPVPLIKKTIEMLMDKQYLERSETDKNLLLYMA